MDLVIYGHLHSYERSWPVLAGRVHPRGITHVQLGGGGGDHERAGPARSWTTHTLYGGFHYGLLRILGERLEMQVFDTDGRLRDSFTLGPKSGR